MIIGKRGWDMKVRMNNQRQPSLSVGKIAKLKDLFERKNWPIEDYFDNHVFDNFCNLLAEYSPEQCDFLISLTEEFLWVNDSDYCRYFDNALHKFICSYDFVRGKKIYFCPALPEVDFEKSKSSVALIYIIKSCLFAIQKKYSDFNITLVDSPRLVDLSVVNKDFTLCLIDDFIGSGETVLNAADYLLRQGLTKDKCVILSLVSMNEGVKILNSNGYTVYSAVQCNKGLSENGTIEQIEMMKSIEDQIRIDEDFRFGYHSSEALVKMMRTPNNTFPIYWFHKRNRNKYAPFPR